MDKSTFCVSVWIFLYAPHFYYVGELGEIKDGSSYHLHFHYHNESVDQHLPEISTLVALSLPRSRSTVMVGRRTYARDDKRK